MKEFELELRTNSSMHHLIGIKAPKLELFFEKWSTDVGRVVQLSRSVIVKDLGEDSGMTIEKVLVKNRVVVGEGFSESRQSRRWNLL